MQLDLGLGLEINKVQQGTVASIYDLLFDSLGQPLYDSNSVRLTAVNP